MKPTIRSFTAGELTELALLAETLNARRKTGSAFCCSLAEDIRKDFLNTMEYNFVFREGGVPKGLFCCFPDPEKRNADCSLLVDATGEDYYSIAHALISAGRDRLGPGMACTFFFPAENRDCRSFLKRAGARQQVNEYVLHLRRGDWMAARSQAAPPRPLGSGEHDAFAALHDTIFPGVYASGKDILADSGKTRMIYVIPDESGLAAYGVLKLRENRQAVAEMVGVRRDARRQGYGRAILDVLARHAFFQYDSGTLELIVDADNENALSLYRKTGFRIAQENNCFILR